MCILYSKLVKESYLFLSQKLLNDIISVMLAQFLPPKIEDHGAYFFVRCVILSSSLTVRARAFHMSIPINFLPFDLGVSPIF